MKNVTVGAITVLFLLVGFGYASAQQNNLNTNLAGALTGLSLQITYENELLPTTTLLEGQSFVTVPSLIGRALSASEAKLAGYKRQDDPIVYMWVEREWESITVKHDLAGPQSQSQHLPGKDLDA